LGGSVLVSPQKALAICPGLPAQEGVFARDYAPEEIAEIARKLRTDAGLSDEPTGVVADNGKGVMDTVKDAVS
jgi:hypothetical protein